jgi:hypothetical protein
LLRKKNGKAMIDMVASTSSTDVMAVMAFANKFKTQYAMRTEAQLFCQIPMILEDGTVDNDKQNLKDTLLKLHPRPPESQVFKLYGTV